MTINFKQRILTEEPHWVTTKGGHTLEVDDDGTVTKGIFTGANLKDKKSVAKKISKLSGVSEAFGDAKYMIVFEKGKLTNFNKSVAPHMEEEYTEKEFAHTIYEYMSDDEGDVNYALEHLFKDVDFEVGGISPKIIFLRCIKKDINVIIHY